MKIPLQRCKQPDETQADIAASNRIDSIESLIVRSYNNLANEEGVEYSGYNSNWREAAKTFSAYGVGLSS